MPKSKINIDLVAHFFGSEPERVFALPDLELLFIEKFDDWNLPASMTAETFVSMLLTRTRLKQLRIRSRSHSSLLRYSWTGTPSPLSVALSIKKDDAYLSHGSAMWIHRLNENDTDIFINKEQSPKPHNSNQLSHEAIHRAFQNQPRRSKRIYKYQDATITLLNGKHTARLEVEPAKTPSGHNVQVTSLERTLIDITVRPVYSGGVSAVLRAFRAAKGRISVSKLVALLHKLDYTYPYHQSIGFYFKWAGYSEADQLLARQKGVKFDFYLCHALKDPAFDSDWRVFFPTNLK